MTDDFDGSERYYQRLRRFGCGDLIFTPEKRGARRAALPGHPLRVIPEEVCDEASEAEKAAEREAAIDAYVAALRAIKS